MSKTRDALALCHRQPRTAAQIAERTGMSLQDAARFMLRLTTRGHVSSLQIGERCTYMTTERGLEQLAKELP